MALKVLNIYDFFLHNQSIHKKVRKSDVRHVLVTEQVAAEDSNECVCLCLFVCMREIMEVCVVFFLKDTAHIVSLPSAAKATFFSLVYLQNTQQQ